MKRIIPLLLALAMLLPMACLGVAKAEAADKIRSFEENFDSYPDGQMTNYKLNDPDFWGYGMVGGTSNIRNKALVLTGTVSYLNQDIPGRIVGGDAYAKDQTWELTVTVPEGLEEDAEIIVLRYEGDGTPVSKKGETAADGGIRITRNTLYYSQLLDKDDPVHIRTEYAKLCTLKPGTYTVKRVLNMNDPEDFTYSLSVVNEAGKEVAKRKNIDCPKFTAITSIIFGANRANKEVIFDNYKLYASGAAADLTLYDTAGKEVDREEIHSAATNYRLSWFNGGEKAKTMILMAAYYENGKVTEKTVLQELTMQPGAEGVETGTVEPAQGQSVKIYLRDPAKERARLIRTILTVLAALAALALAAVGVIFLVKLLKKAKIARDAKRKAFFEGEDV